MTRKIAAILKDTRGEIAINFVTVFLVMAILLVAVAATSFIASYITYNRLISEIEQNLNDSAAKAEKSFLFLAENDKGDYTVDSDTLQEMQQKFQEEFLRNLKTETDEWDITNIDIQMYQSTENGFSVLHRLTCHIKIKITLFDKDIGIFEKDVSLNGRHQFADVSIQNIEETSVAGQDTGEGDIVESVTGEESGSFVTGKGE